MDTRPSPSWDELNPPIKEGPTLAQARHHFETRQAIAAQPRNILGLSILKALGGPMPTPPRGAMVDPGQVAESARRMAQMREERPGQAPEPIVRPVADAPEQVREVAARIEAQATFEAQMRAAELRRSLLG